MSDLPDIGGDQAAPIDLGAAARAWLQANGWTVNPPYSSAHFRADREGQTLVGLVCKGSEDDALEQSYRQILGPDGIRRTRQTPGLW